MHLGDRADFSSRAHRCSTRQVLSPSAGEITYRFATRGNNSATWGYFTAGLDGEVALGTVKKRLKDSNVGLAVTNGREINKARPLLGVISSIIADNLSIIPFECLLNFHVITTHQIHQYESHNNTI